MRLDGFRCPPLKSLFKSPPEHLPNPEYLRACLVFLPESFTYSSTFWVAFVYTDVTDAFDPS